MKQLWLPIFVICMIVALVCFTMGERTVEAAKPVKKAVAAQASCEVCHANFTSVLPKAHPVVHGKDIKACVTCHSPDLTGKPLKNSYSTRMHQTHLPPKGKLDCTGCHSWTPGKRFGLIGVDGSWGAPTKEEMKLMKEIFASWASSQYSDNRHAVAGIGCAGCHGKDIPKADDTVENQRCLACHGPTEKIVKNSEPKDFPDRNPHKSHLGEINCTVCHHKHTASKAYCLECHPKFEMKMPGGMKK